MPKRDTPEAPKRVETAHILEHGGNEQGLVLTNNRRDRQHHALALYGNYWNYYFHRAPAVPDARLSLLPPELFMNKNVLDLGCNAGKLTVETCTHLGATRALGIDLDNVLIEKAKDYCRKACDHVSTVVGICKFSCDDFMAPGYWADFLHSYGTFDTILLLSITKWLHLHHGDAGLVGLFRQLFKILPGGGTLIIEPQEWQNYKRAVSKNTALRPMYKELNLRPNFDQELNGIGFKLSMTVMSGEGGFSRPLMVWTKPDVLGLSVV